MVPDDTMKKRPGEARTQLASPGRRATMLALAALAAPSVLLPRAARAQSWPDGPVRIIVPFAGGTPPDTYCRVFGEKLSHRIGQPVIIDLRPGASTTIGTAFAAKAKPDGQTIAYLTNSSLTAAPNLFKSLQYDPEKDFSAITVMLESYFCIGVRPEDAKLTLQDFAERVRQNPGNAMGGGSSTAEVANMLFTKAAGLNHAYARYNSNQSYNDLFGGRLSAVWAPLNSALAMARQGKLHILAITGPRRVSVLPDVPTLNEVYPGVIVESWSGFFVPSSTPRPLVATLYEHVDAVVRDPEIQERGRQDGTQPLKLSPEQSDAYVTKDFPRWKDLLTSAGIEPQ